MPVPAEIARSRHISLVTYRGDGTPVTTPVWHAVHGDEVFVVSEADAWKVRRIRANGAVTVSPCDLRGKVPPGAVSVPGTARLLDAPGTRMARGLIADRYLTSRVGNWLARTLRIRRSEIIGIAITF